MPQWWNGRHEGLKAILSLKYLQKMESCHAGEAINFDFLKILV